MAKRKISNIELGTSFLDTVTSSKAAIFLLLIIVFSILKISTSVAASALSASKDSDKARMGDGIALKKIQVILNCSSNSKDAAYTIEAPGGKIMAIQSIPDRDNGLKSFWITYDSPNDIQLIKIKTSYGKPLTCNTKFLLNGLASYKFTSANGLILLQAESNGPYYDLKQLY